MIAALSGETPLDVALQRDPETGVWVLPAQAAPAARAELFASPEFPALIAELRRRFDVVALDAPPALAVADARLVAAQADATVFALRWGETERAEVCAALRALSEGGAKLAGLALIGAFGRADPRKSDVRGGGRYGRFSEYFED